MSGERSEGAASPSLHQLPYRGHFNVTGRGVCYSFLPEDLPEDVNHPNELIGTDVMVGMVRVRVTAVEHWAIICPRGDERCRHPFSLLVKP